MRNFEYLPVTTTGQAIEGLGSGSAPSDRRPRILAGGTDLLDEMKEGIVSPHRLVSLKDHSGLRFIRFQTRQGLTVGALTTLSELQAHPDLVKRYPVLEAALASIASPQIRNMATVAGNLCQRPRCWYYRDQALNCARKGGPICYALEGENTHHAILGGNLCVIVHPSDLAPALIAYGATVTIAGPEGRTTIPLEEFFIGPDRDITRENLLSPQQLVEEIRVPPPGRGSRGVFLKVRDRGSWDFATLSVASVLEMEGTLCRGARVVLGAVAPRPWPVPRVDEMLAGEEITPELASRAAEKALEGASPLEHNGYKVLMGRNLVRQAILEAAGIVR